MLVLSRNIDQTISLVVNTPGQPPIEITLMLVDIRDNARARIGITAPPQVKVLRGELRKQELLDLERKTE